MVGIERNQRVVEIEQGKAHGGFRQGRTQVEDSIDLMSGMVMARFSTSE